MASIVPSERVRAQLDAALQGAGGEGDPIEAVGRLGARLILQQALEDEVTEFLGRGRYERTGEASTHRNGYERTTVKTTSGPVELERPRLRNQGALSFASQLVGKGVARTHALEALVIASFLRGLSVRDVEAALEETFDKPMVSKSTVSRVCQDTRERYRAWCRRSGSLAVTLRSACTVQRCERAWGHSSRVAFQIPGAPSAITSAGGRMPRSCRSRPKASQLS
jgi:putative transposase